MKVMMPVDEGRDTVCAVFARALEFLVYDTEQRTSVFLTNPAAAAQGGAGIKAAQFLVDQRADILITVRCGENSAEVLKEAGIKIFKSEGIGVKENLEALTNGNLKEMDSFHGGFHGHR